MALKIDGYIAADPTIANDTGVELNYETKYGIIAIRAKSSGHENMGFKKASEALLHRRNVRAKTGGKADENIDLRETLKLWADHVVIAWSTTITSDGKDIKSTPENFVDLLSNDELLVVFMQLTEDCADNSNFAKAAEAEAEKN